MHYRWSLCTKSMTRTHEIGEEWDKHLGANGEEATLLFFLDKHDFSELQWNSRERKKY